MKGGGVQAPSLFRRYGTRGHHGSDSRQYDEPGPATRRQDKIDPGTRETAQENFRPSDYAWLRRSNAQIRSDVDHASSELIGAGALFKMVRAALNDPDDEIWRYSLVINDTILVGGEIRSLAALVPVNPADAVAEGEAINSR